MKVAIVDYSLGNLYSVKNACGRAGLDAAVTSSRDEILGADGVILPGVGAFGDAMDQLRRLDLIAVLKEIAQSPIPLMGICLGLQLLMTESHEFGQHEGLGIIEGSVVRFDAPADPAPLTPDPVLKTLKVPHVAWNRYLRPDHTATGETDPWESTPLEGLSDGEYAYFVHSFYAKPENRDVVLSVSRYGDVEFCSSVRKGRVFACQFHPERSGLQGLKIYRNFAEQIRAAAPAR